jgi:hypothetical protein
MIISVDPGEHAAYCIWQEMGGVYRPVYHARIKDPSIDKCIFVMKDFLANWTGSTLVVEDQFFVPAARAGRFRSAPVNKVFVLIERRTRWQHAAQLLGAEVALVLPSKWQKGANKYPGETSKERTRKLVLDRYGIDLPERKDGDEADAIGIGDWYIRTLGKDGIGEDKQLSMF